MTQTLPVTAKCPEQNAAEILQSEGDEGPTASSSASDEKVGTAQQVETTSRETATGEPEQQQEQQTKSTTPKKEKHLLSSHPSVQPVDEDSLIEVSFTNTKWGYTNASRNRVTTTRSPKIPHTKQ